jgi:hypothetical protein
MKIDPSPPVPSPNAFLLCDQAIKEEKTGKVSLIGIFENVNAKAFPVQHAALTLYLKSSGAEGKYSWRCELVRMEDEMVIMSQDIGETDHKDRLATQEMLITIASIIFERPGRYEFRIYANESIVGSKTFKVLES